MVASAWAQTETSTPSPATTNNGFWQADLSGGSYAVRIISITSVSQHEYVVEGGIKVTEVVIDTMGAAVVRFYYMEPFAAATPDGIGQGTIEAVAERAREVASRVGLKTNLVTKTYPATTHAHTIEYSLDSKESLAKLFASARHAFISGNAATFRP